MSKSFTSTAVGLVLRPQEGSRLPGPAAIWSGKKYVFPANDEKIEAATLEPTGDSATLVLRCNGAEQRIACGKGAWAKGRLAYGTMPEQPVAASGAWQANDTYAVKLCFYETPTVVTVRN